MQVIIGYGAVVAFSIVSIGSLLQILKTIGRKSVDDISIPEVFLRLLASILIWLRILFTADLYLIIGEGIWILIYFCYFVIVAYLVVRKKTGRAEGGIIISGNGEVAVLKEGVKCPRCEESYLHMTERRLLELHSCDDFEELACLNCGYYNNT